MPPMETLRQAYDRAAPLLNACESFAVAQAVETVREFWKPAKVKVVLLAESHVFTSDDESGVRLDTRLIPVPGLPREYVRFVYCLGYGESRLLMRNIPGNKGTPQPCVST